MTHRTAFCDQEGFYPFRRLVTGNLSSLLFGRSLGPDPVRDAMFDLKALAVEMSGAGPAIALTSATCSS